MKEYLEMLKVKALEHKEILIRVGSAVAGALVGAAVATIVANNQEELLLEEQMDLELIEEETTEE